MQQLQWVQHTCVYSDCTKQLGVMYTQTWDDENDSNKDDTVTAGPLKLKQKHELGATGNVDVQSNDFCSVLFFLFFFSFVFFFENFRPPII